MTEDQQRMLDALLELDEGLRDREVDFVEDLSHRDRDSYHLTQKQADWLEAIHWRLLG